MTEIDQAKINFQPVVPPRGSTKIYAYGEDKDKKVVKCKFCRHQDEKERFQNERSLAALAALHDDQNIVCIEGFVAKLREIPKGAYNLYFLMPRMEGDLNQLLARAREKRQYVPLKDLLQYLSDLANGVRSCHHQKIIHRNINPFNILYDEEKNLKLSDFSSALNLNDMNPMNISNSLGDEQSYKAPEIQKQNKQKMKEDDYYKHDIWSLGIVFLEICLLSEKLNLDISSSQLEKLVEKNLNKVQEIYNTKIANLLRGMLEINPTQRKNINEICESIKKIKSELKGDLTQPTPYLDESDKENVNFLNKTINQEEFLKNSSLFCEKKLFLSEKNAIRNEVFRSKIEHSDLQQEEEKDSLSTEKMMNKTSSPVERNKTSIFRKFSTQVYQTPPEVKEIIIKRKSSLSERGNLNSAISEIQKQFNKDFEIDLSWDPEQAFTLVIFTRDRDDLVLEDEMMKTFVQAIFGCFESSGMKSSLTKIVVQLNHCSELTDKFLKYFGSSITQRFEKLSSLNVAFSKPISEPKALKFTNEGLENFTKKIGENFNNLQSLTLSFSCCPGLNTKGIKKFAKLFEQYFQQLKELTLSFTSCSHVADDALCSLGKTVSENQNRLQMFKLCGSMKDETKKKLVSKFGEIIRFD